MEGDAETKWVIQLFGEFRLISPDRRECVARHRKLQGLLALLVYHRHLGIDRSEAGQILWPATSQTAQKDNLRQTLLLVRKTLGSESLLGTRERIRLSDHFHFHSDLEEPPKDGSLFMPLQEGEWFEDARRAFDLGEPSESKQLMESYFQTLDWLAESKPKAAYGLLEETFYFAIGLSSEQMLAIVKKCGRVAGYEEWHDLWLGYGLKGVSEEGHLKAINSAFMAAIKVKNPMVSAWAGKSVATAHILSGNFSKARQISTYLAGTPGVTRHAARLIEANTFKGEGVLPRVFEELARFDEQVEDSDYRHVRLVSSAFVAAVAGKYTRAIDDLALYGDYSRRSGHILANHLETMTRGLLAVGSGQVERGTKLIESIADGTDVVPDPTLVVYAREALALNLKRLGEPQIGKEKWDKARKSRVRLGMAITPWDRIVHASFRR